MIRTSKKICLYGAVTIAVVSNLVNYFWYYKVLDDRVMQWKVAMIAISSVIFLQAVYIWVNESLKRKGLSIIISGWFALYTLFNMIGVALGYNLHTKGFMAILIITTMAGLGHVLIRLWRNLFL
jgi:hypothetical protein